MTKLKREGEDYADAYQYGQAIQLAVTQGNIKFSLRRLNGLIEKAQSFQSLPARTAYLPEEKRGLLKGHSPLLPPREFCVRRLALSGCLNPLILTLNIV
ncbi:hypothetical protein ID47_03845 [Candidatus Paracaedibacter acanthamoebae]|uniref:Uncharacterized protein n=1 Tax=Candidatus Odyssella acanthamoebae TaxID=91604 RepID=A0A077AZ88_9PROT|nr:hypothetical protein ID47_03845 [Candidatus Paracaedibacter acanthamoebae]